MMQIKDIKYINQNFVPFFDFISYSLKFIIFINTSLILNGVVHLQSSQIINWNLRSDDGSDFHHFFFGESLSSGVDPDEVHGHHVSHWSKTAVHDGPSVIVGANYL